LQTDTAAFAITDASLRLSSNFTTLIARQVDTLPHEASTSNFLLGKDEHPTIKKSEKNRKVSESKNVSGLFISPNRNFLKQGEGLVLPSLLFYYLAFASSVTSITLMPKI
jgi:hypothetical protein